MSQFLPGTIRYAREDFPDSAPFTLRSARSYEDILSAVRIYLRDTVSPYIEGEQAQEVWDTNAAALTAAVDARIDAAITALAEASIPVTEAAVVAALTGGSQLRGALDYSYGQVTIFDLPTRNLWIGHHGGGLLPYSSMPENTLTSIRAAIAMGASIIDLDIRQTKDGVLVNFHDTDTALLAPTVSPPVSIENQVYYQLPQIDMRNRLGSGFAPENIAMLRHIFAEFGGSVVFSIELKGGIGLLPAVADLVKKFKLEKSTFINYHVSGIAVADTVSAAGLYSYAYGCASVADVQAALAKPGVMMLELDATAATTDVIVAAQGIAARGGRFIASPQNSRTARQALDPRYNGYTTDSPGYVTRDYGVPITRTLTDTLRSGKQGLGWIARNPYNLPDPTNWLTPAGVVLFDGGIANRVQLRDFAGDHGQSYSFTFKSKWLTLPTATTDWAGIRACGTAEVPTSDVSSDPAHKGYVFALRANGQVAIFRVDPVSGVSSNIGSTTNPVPLVAGTEYSVRVDVTPTTITATRLDTGNTTGPISDTTWRGGYYHAHTTAASGKVLLTGLDFSA